MLYDLACHIVILEQCFIMIFLLLVITRNRGYQYSKQCCICIFDFSTTFTDADPDFGDILMLIMLMLNYVSKCFRKWKDSLAGLSIHLVKKVQSKTKVFELCYEES